VPADRSGHLPGTVSLSIERKLAGGEPSRSAVVALAGGPGQAAIPLADFIAEAIAPALAGRDLIVFDQRGTGTSSPLSCPALSGREPATSNPALLIPRCASQLGPARGEYTTQESIEDIEAIRRAGGYEKLVLYGTSYGTKVALDYAARHPDRVEALVLDSTETPEGPDPFRLGTYQTIEPMLEELCSKGACAGIARSPLSELHRLIARTEARPIRVSWFDRAGRRRHGTITQGEIFALLLGGDLNPVLRAELPAAVHAAVHGDGAPLARLLALAGTGPEGSSEVDNTLFVDTTCEETRFPWDRAASEATRAVEAENALNALPSGAFYPFSAEAGLIDETIPTCVSWPDASAAPAPTGPEPNVPTLILSGGQDLRTPRANALAVARLIPDAQLLAVPYTGHSVVGSDPSECSKQALTAFFSGGSVSQCAPTPNHFPPTHAPPASLARVAPARGTHGPAGRTAAAALATVTDMRVQFAGLLINFGSVPVGTRFGGLRGGWFQITGAGVRLHDLVAVGGVTVSGLVPKEIVLGRHSGPAARLEVGGSAAADGNLRLSASGAVTGSLGGRPVRTRLPARSASLAGAEESAWPGHALPARLRGIDRLPR
jgi:pimeloyl-ACP methyl ester carboxylesterase